MNCVQLDQLIATFVDWCTVNRYCRMTNYVLLRWLVETRSRDVGHNRTLHSWAYVDHSGKRWTTVCWPFVIFDVSAFEMPDSL